MQGNAGVTQGNAGPERLHEKWVHDLEGLDVGLLTGLWALFGGAEHSLGLSRCYFSQTQVRWLLLYPNRLFVTLDCRAIV